MVKRRNCPNTAQTQHWWDTIRPILTNSGQFLLKFFKGLGKRYCGHSVLIFSTSRTRNDAPKDGKTSFCQECRTNQGWVSASACSFPGKTINDVINTEGKYKSLLGNMASLDVTLASLPWCALL